MKKQLNPSVKAHLLQGARYLILLVAVCVIPFALGQRVTTKQSAVADPFLLGSGPVATLSTGDDAAGGTWTFTGNLNTARYYHTATLLPDGTVLIAGGYSVWLWPNPGGSSSAELYVPRLLTPPLVVNDLRFDLTVVTAGASYSVTTTIERRDIRLRGCRRR